MLNKEIQALADKLVKRVDDPPTYDQRAQVMQALQKKFPKTQRATLVSAFGRAMRKKRNAK